MMHRQKIVNLKSGILIITSCLVIYTLYYNFHEYNIYKIDYTDLEKVTRISRKQIYTYNGSENFLINTKGCYIPNYGKTMIFTESRISKKNCGERAIFITKTENDKEIEFRIDTEILNIYSKNKTLDCYYSFGRRLTTAGLENKSLSYTKWKSFENGTKITLEHEIITVMCNSVPLYEDAYVFIKKMETESPKSEEKTWNVLIVGMDTMSRARLINSMPGTVQYFQKQGWLDYKGYHKVGYNTFPNLMAFLTGKKMSTIYSRCTQSLYDCNDLFIWSKFRGAGYMTAYGEDNLRLPDTFSRYNGFRINPTHHYIRPFFLTGEKLIGNYICAHHKPSALHMLNYAYDFTNTYKEDKFFGTFWINSFSHNLEYNPKLFDKDMVKFFERLKDNEVLNNTIVVFTSDHGIRFGKMRLPIESYYEERLPMLFVWIPHEFRQMYKQKYYNLQLNQNRLATPYDIYLTLEEILNNFTHSDIVTEACPQSSSLFVEKSTHRTCEDACIDDKWCSCHRLTEVKNRDSAANSSIQAAVKYIQDNAKLVKTKHSKKCRSTHLTKLIRIHSYIGRGNRTHYVVAWQTNPGAMSYEATVVKEDGNFTVLEPTHAMASYESHNQGNCLVNPYDREFCIC